ncbi:MAG: HAD hydrolase-like protein [Alphaproteobacteria bacterium]|nr:HAD hydrolase-like protein [Alphaproteobacteria bacterium]
MTLKAVIFDVGGTIAETADVKRAAFNQAFAELGLDWVWGRAAFAQILTNALPGAEVEFYALLRNPAMFNRLERNGLLDEIPKRQQQIYFNLLEAGAAPLRPGVARLMGEIASSGVKLAICSTGPRLEYETLLFNRFGLEIVDALSVAVSGEDLQGASPVQAYRTCVANLGLPPGDIAVIENSAQGAAAAASLGMAVIATPSLYTMGQKFPGARVVISDLGHPAAPFSVFEGDLSGISHLSLEVLADVMDIPARLDANAA